MKNIIKILKFIVIIKNKKKVHLIILMLCLRMNNIKFDIYLFYILII
jgi:hypothetical protein